jgi:Universal stress protein family
MSAATVSSPANPAADGEVQSPKASEIPLPTSQPSSSSSPHDALARAPSIHFSDSALPARPQGQRSGSSLRQISPPPVIKKFEKGVSFDTFEKKGEPVLTSFTLSRKHGDFEHKKSTRTFLCGLDDNDYSNFALEWLLDELVDDNDEIICLRVVDKDSTIAGTASLEHKTYKEEAEKLMIAIEEKNHDNKAISIILEFAVGKVEKMIMTMVSYTKLLKNNY